MIIIVSNRDVYPKKSDHKMFGNSFNKNGQDFLRLATRQNRAPNGNLPS